MNAKVVLFGNVSMLRGYCSKCKTHALIIDGVLQCCDTKIETIDANSLHRESEAKGARAFGKLLKKELVELQNNKCIYCEKEFDSYVMRNNKFIQLKVNIDHFVPWTFVENTKKINAVAACQICNGIKSNKHFPDLVSAKEYINAKRKEKQIT